MSFVAGPAVVGLPASVGPVAPAVLTMVLIAAAALPFALLHAPRDIPRKPSADHGRPHLPRRPLAVMFLAMAAMGVIFGAVQTAVTVYADAVGEPGVSGLVYAEFGIGSALAGAACVWLPRRFSLRARCVTFTALLFVGTLVPFFGARLVSVPAAVAVAGFTVAPYMISLYALTERLAPSERAAIAMTVLRGGGPLGAAAGQAVSGALAETHGTDGALLLALAATMVDRGREVWITDSVPADPAIALSSGRG